VKDWPEGWDADRAAVVFAAVLYGGLWVQVGLMHWAGGFKKRAMWVPVVVTPLLVAAAVAGTVSRGGAFGGVMAGVLAVGVAVGLVGVALHVRGIVGQVGGWSLRNALAGPPPVLPLAYALIGVLGIGGLVWHA
jgi:hypothetical protein